jgi:hypothetical protein
MTEKHSGVLQTIRQQGQLDETTAEGLHAAAKEYKASRS